MDLFDNASIPPPIPGLRLQPDFIGAEEENALIAHIDALDMAPFRFQQWTGKRLSQSFGWHYDFQSGAGINWHRDRPQFEHVFGISLGMGVNMRFRRKVDQRWQRVSVPLPARSLYRLSGEVRHE